MSKTALDLCRAVDRLVTLRFELGVTADGAAPDGHDKHMDRIGRAIERLAARLQAIPADALRQIADLEARIKNIYSNREETFGQTRRTPDEAARQIAELNSSLNEAYQKLSEISECCGVPDRVGCTMCATIIAHGSGLRREADAKIAKLEAEIIRLHNERGSAFDTTELLKRNKELRKWSASLQAELADLRWNGPMEEKEDAPMTEGERRVRAMSTELLRDNLTAVGQVRGQWQAMAKGLLEKKPECQMCKVRPSEDCAGVCALCEFDGAEFNDCGLTYNEWEKAIQAARHYDLDMPQRLRDSTVMAAACKMAELFDRLHGVIADELNARKVTKIMQQAWEDSEAARSPHPNAEMWCGYKVGELVQFINRTGTSKVLTVAGGDAARVAVKGPNDSCAVWVFPEEIVRAEEIWHGFKKGTRVYHRPRKHNIVGVIVGGDEKMVTVKYDDGRVHSTYPVFIEPILSWHGFEEGERVRNTQYGIEGVVFGGDERYVHAERGEMGPAYWLPKTLVCIPVTPEPDCRCGTCAYWPKSGPRENRCAADASTLPDSDAGTACKEWKPRDCSTCDDHSGACDGDSTPPDGCWRGPAADPEPWPGWGAQAPARTHAEFTGGHELLITWDGVKRSISVCRGEDEEDGRKFATIINELAYMAGLVGKEQRQ